MRRCWLRLVVVASLLNVTGCMETADSGAEYLQRLANVLEQPVPAGQTQPVPTTTLPLPAELVLERSAEKLTIFSAVDLHRCELGPLVAARNGSLGRVHQPSQRFAYDRSLVAGIARCRDRGEALVQVLQQRQAELPVSAFNALFAGPEFHSFATPAASLSRAPLDAQGVARALQRLTESLTDHSSPLSAQQLEADLSVLRFSNALGRQRLVWHQQSDVLERANTMLDAALADNPGCRTGKPTPAGRARFNVFQQFYVAQFQRELSAQGQPDRGWLGALGTLLERVLGALPAGSQQPGVARFWSQVAGSAPTSEYGRWRRAIDDHTGLWQQQLRRCGLMPGVNVQPQRS